MNDTTWLDHDLFINKIELYQMTLLMASSYFMVISSEFLIRDVTFTTGHKKTLTIAC
jgi:hypothetical protein